jgi:hypothetical protein
MRTLTLVLISATGLMMPSCQDSDLGTGANTVGRDYARSAPDAWKAAVRSAESSGLTILSDSHDKFGGELVASRANGDDVRIEVRSLNEQSARVTVRVEPGDRALATMIHERMAEKMGLGAAKPGFFGGSSIEGLYLTDLESCRAPARRAFAALDVTPTAEDVHVSGWRLDGRLKDSTPIRISAQKEGDLRTRVTFVAGAEKSDDLKAFAQRMKEEFEAAIHLESSSE